MLIETKDLGSSYVERKPTIQRHGTHKLYIEGTKSIIVLLYKIYIKCKKRKGKRLIKTMGNI